MKRSRITLILCGARLNPNNFNFKLFEQLSPVCSWITRSTNNGPGRSDHPESLWAHSLLVAEADAPVSCQKLRRVMRETATRPQSRPLLPLMLLAVAYRTASCSSPSAPSETRSRPGQSLSRFRVRFRFRFRQGT